MVTVGFVVEGASEKRLVESELFRKWLREDCNLKVVDPVVDAAGNGNMCSHNIETFVKNLRTIANPNKVVVLADLDPDICAPCVQKRKEIIGSQGIDLVVIAKKAMESWFLADTKAMRQWLGNDAFCEPHPETLDEMPDEMPWDRLKKLRTKQCRGPGSKLSFARKFIHVHGFDVRRAARHAHCPSARYFVERLCALGNPN
ncbi:MAG: DUF4276 family protein [Candidatus Latescibacteria bacterium]|nr:DUF4276 family protein [Candidatus Latescibacterota bacterium]